MSLDDKLKDAVRALGDNEGNYSDWELDDCVAQIKQVFQEEGYIQHPHGIEDLGQDCHAVQYAYDSETKTVNGKPIAQILETDNTMMTGAEWYDRFKAELQPLIDAYKGRGDDPVYNARLHSLELAKWAAGVSDE